MAPGIGDTTDNPKTKKIPKNPKKNAWITNGFCPSVLLVLRRSRPRRRLPPWFSHSPFSFRGLLYDFSS
jgi:hypothetical protein